MNWKIRLKKYEDDKNWKAVIDLMIYTINTNPNDVEVYVYFIYLLHNILMEEDYLESEHNYISSLLKQYFDDSRKRFAENAEYLFFIGKILYIGEWYFDLDDDFKPVEEKEAFRMQKKASEIEPGNILFEWAYRFSLGDSTARSLAKEILSHNQTIIVWLKSKGFPGEYILESLRRNS
jgi:hypothetical protein